MNELNSVEVDDKGLGNDYFDIFGAAHKLADGAIDGANMMTDGVMDGGLEMAGGALDGVNRMADGAIGGLYCLFHRCGRQAQRGQGGKRVQGQKRGQGQDYFDIFGAAHKLTDGAIDGVNIMTDGVINAGLGIAGGALGGVKRMTDGAVGGIWCLLSHRCRRPQRPTKRPSYRPPYYPSYQQGSGSSEMYNYL